MHNLHIFYKTKKKKKKKKKLFGCPPLPTPNFLEKTFYCTKVYPHLTFFIFKKIFFENFDL